MAVGADGRRRTQGRSSLPWPARRRFLRAGGVAGSALVLGQRWPQVAGAAPGTGRGRSTKVAFRLSARGRPSCNACRAHNANRFYATVAAADQDRPHAGCNCSILPHPLHVRDWIRYFQPRGRGSRRSVYDQRWAT